MILTFLNSNHIRSLFLDKDTLWIGTQKGLSIMNIKTKAVKNHRFYANQPELKKEQREDDVVRTIFRDKKGDTWLTPGYNGLVKFDNSRKKFINYPLEKSPKLPSVFPIRHHYTLYQAVQDMYRDSIIWGITGADLVKFNKNTGQYQRIRFNYPFDTEIEHNLNRVRSLYQHTDGKIYMGTWNRGMWVFDPSNESFFSPVVENQVDGKTETNNIGISGFYFKSDSEFYATFATGLYIFNVDSKMWKLIKLNDLKSSKEIRYGVSFIDSQQRIWFGNSNGFTIFDPIIQQYDYYSLGNLNEADLKCLPREAIEDFYPGYVTITSQYSDGIFHVNPTTGDLFKTPISEKYLSEKRYFNSWGITFLSDDEFLANNRTGVFYYKKGMKEAVPYKWQPRQKFSSLGNIAVDQRDRVWVGSYDDGLWTINYKTGEVIDQTPRIQRSAVSKNFADKKGNIWFKISGGHAVYSANADSIFVFPYDQDTTKTFPNVSAFCKCPNGEVWMAGGVSGLGLVSSENPEKGILKKRIVNNGDRDLRAYQVACDSNNNLWALSYNEIININRTDWIATDYSTQYGLNNHTVIFDFLKNDHLVIGAREGVYFVDPKTLRKNKQLPKPYISTIKTNKNNNYSTETLLEKKPIHLSPNENNFTIEFSAINHTFPHSVKFLYRLEGLDKDWKDPGKNRSIIYSNIKGGKYKFKLKAANNENLWSEEVYELDIFVGTPWYQTYWFYFLLLLVFSGLVLSIYKFRIGQIKRESKIKTAFEKRIATVEMSALRAQMNPHFIFNCLNSIENYIIKNDTIKASEYLNKFWAFGSFNS